MTAKINLKSTAKNSLSMEIMSLYGFHHKFSIDFFKHFFAGEDFVYFESNDDMLQKINI